MRIRFRKYPALEAYELPLRYIVETRRPLSLHTYWQCYTSAGLIDIIKIVFLFFTYLYVSSLRWMFSCFLPGSTIILSLADRLRQFIHDYSHARSPFVIVRLPEIFLRRLLRKKLEKQTPTSRTLDKIQFNLLTLHSSRVRCFVFLFQMKRLTFRYSYIREICPWGYVSRYHKEEINYYKYRSVWNERRIKKGPRKEEPISTNIRTPRPDWALIR